MVPGVIVNSDHFTRHQSDPIPAIAAVGLVQRYRHDDEPALDNINLVINQGEFFGLLGPNGAGKTTAFSILSGLREPNSGSVKVHGMEYRNQRRALHRIIGIVPQEIALYERLTARENLIFFGRLLGLRRGQLRTQVEHCLEIAQLPQRADQPVAFYSGGMKRRLNLVIGLLNEPRILFLDEPTVGIDTQSRHLIHQRLQQLHEQGKTILYTTHYMEEAQHLCSRIAVLDHGRILQEGTPDALLQHTDHTHLEDLFLDLTGKQLRDT
jgi:ABC-2 type transport system ATP-binding protein